MTQRTVPGLFVTGTDTGVGKTYVTACIARRLRRDGLRVGRLQAGGQRLRLARRPPGQRRCAGPVGRGGPLRRVGCRLSPAVRRSPRSPPGCCCGRPCCRCGPAPRGAAAVARLRRRRLGRGRRRVDVPRDRRRIRCRPGLRLRLSPAGRRRQCPGSDQPDPANADHRRRVPRGARRGGHRAEPPSAGAAG